MSPALPVAPPSVEPVEPAAAAEAAGPTAEEAPPESGAEEAREAAAAQMSELFGLLGEEEAAQLLMAYSESNGVGGAAEILVRLDAKQRSLVLRELQRSSPDEVGAYIGALETALAAQAKSASGAAAAAAAAATSASSTAKLREEAERVIDDWHAAAASGDRDGYLGGMTPGARFLGTDSTERWDMSQFTAYVEEHFKPGSGWTFQPADRVLLMSASGEVAWFDERLASASYGELRGTGVLERIDEAWRVAHYSMTFTVPNDVAGEVVDAVGRSEQ